MPCRIETDSRTREKNQKSTVSSFSKEKKFKLCLTIIAQYLSLKREAWSLIAFLGPPIHDREGSKNGGPANYFHRNEFAFFFSLCRYNSSYEDRVVSYTLRPRYPFLAIQLYVILREDLRFCVLLGLRFLPTRSLTLVIKPITFSHSLCSWS